MLYIECKHHGRGRPVDVGIVRELYCVIEGDGIGEGILVTTSRYSPEAREFERMHHKRIHLMQI